MRAVIAATILWLCSTPLLADQLVLRCDTPNRSLAFSVLIDTAKRAVLGFGYGSKVETERFTETIIAASDKEDAGGAQNLVIDRVTGQFQLTWTAANPDDKGGDLQGTCAPARRQF
jgi:hypothetical protein